MAGCHTSASIPGKRRPPVCRRRSVCLRPPVQNTCGHSSSIGGPAAQFHRLVVRNTQRAHASQGRQTRRVVTSGGQPSSGPSAVVAANRAMAARQWRWPAVRTGGALWRTACHQPALRGRAKGVARRADKPHACRSRQSGRGSVAKRNSFRSCRRAKERSVRASFPAGRWHQPRPSRTIPGSSRSRRRSCGSRRCRAASPATRPIAQASSCSASSEDQPARAAEVRNSRHSVVAPARLRFRSAGAGSGGLRRYRHGSPSVG